MGTIVINQTDCKQNVVLQSSVDGITGGYYDAAGEWHEFGGNDKPYPPFVDITLEVGGLDKTIKIASPLVIENKTIKQYDGEYSTLIGDDRLIVLSSGQKLTLRLYTSNCGDDVGEFSAFLSDEEEGYTKSGTNLVNATFNIDEDFPTNYRLSIVDPFEKASAKILYE